MLVTLSMLCIMIFSFSVSALARFQAFQAGLSPSVAEDSNCSTALAFMWVGGLCYISAALLVVSAACVKLVRWCSGYSVTCSDLRRRGSRWCTNTRVARCVAQRTCCARCKAACGNSHWPARRRLPSARWRTRRALVAAVGLMQLAGTLGTISLVYYPSSFQCATLDYEVALCVCAILFLGQFTGMVALAFLFLPVFCPNLPRWQRGGSVRYTQPPDAGGAPPPSRQARHDSDVSDLHRDDRTTQAHTRAGSAEGMPSVRHQPSHDAGDVKPGAGDTRAPLLPGITVAQNSPSAAEVRPSASFQLVVEPLWFHADELGRGMLLVVVGLLLAQMTAGAASFVFPSVLPLGTLAPAAVLGPTVPSWVLWCDSFGLGLAIIVVVGNNVDNISRCCCRSCTGGHAVRVASRVRALSPIAILVSSVLLVASAGCVLLGWGVNTASRCGLCAVRVVCVRWRNANHDLLSSQ